MSSKRVIHMAATYGVLNREQVKAVARLMAEVGATQAEVETTDGWSRVWRSRSDALSGGVAEHAVPWSKTRPANPMPDSARGQDEWYSKLRNKPHTVAKKIGALTMVLYGRWPILVNTTFGHTSAYVSNNLVYTEHAEVA